jgi:hypothetical protein
MESQEFEPWVQNSGFTNTVRKTREAQRIQAWKQVWKKKAVSMKQGDHRNDNSISALWRRLPVRSSHLISRRGR